MVRPRSLSHIHYLSARWPGVVVKERESGVSAAAFLSYTWHSTVVWLGIVVERKWGECGRVPLSYPYLPVVWPGRVVMRRESGVLRPRFPSHTHHLLARWLGVGVKREEVGIVRPRSPISHPLFVDKVSGYGGERERKWGECGRVVIHCYNIPSLDVLV